MPVNPFQNAFGLDIGDRSIKILELQNRSFGRKYKVKHASQVDLPEGLIINGEIEQPEEVVKILRGHLQKQAPHLLKNPWVVACLPETKTYIQLITLPVDSKTNKVTEEEIKKAAPSYLPYEIDTIYLDWQEIGRAPNGEMRVLFAAAPKQVVDSYTYLLNIAGLIPLAFEVEAMSIARAIINRKKDLSAEARGILDLGATRSSFIIFDHDVIQFSLSLPISGLQMTEKIQKVMDLEFASAEKMKKECGIDKKCEIKVKKVLEEALDELTDKLFQAIQFYKLHFPNKNTITGIRLCGGGSNLPALENYLSAKLKIKIRKANPWVNLFPKGSEPLPESESLSYTTVIGLAIRALEKPIVF